MEPPLTSLSLLARLRSPADEESWREFDRLYRELLVRFCCRQGLSAADAEDVTQKVLIGISRALPQFTYDPARGRFRNYLFRCARNGILEWIERQKKAADPLFTSGGGLAVSEHELHDADPGLEAAWEAEWVAHHYRLAMSVVRETFDARSVAVFDRSIAGASVRDLAMEHQMSEQAIYKVRQRVRARLEELIAQQVQEEDALDEA